MMKSTLKNAVEDMVFVRKVITDNSYKMLNWRSFQNLIQRDNILQ